MDESGGRERPLRPPLEFTGRHPAGGDERRREQTMAETRAYPRITRGRRVAAAMVAAQGGPADLLDRPEAHLAGAAVVRPVEAADNGCIASVDTLAVGDIVVALGGGRRRVDDRIDPSVGLSDLKSIGEPVVPGEPLAWVHAASEATWQAAASALRRAFQITKGTPAGNPVVHSIVEGIRA